MKALFLIFHGFNPANGISKKIQYQVDALQACGVDTRLCYMREPAGRKLRMIDSEILRDYGTGIKGKILKRIEYSSIVEYVRKEGIDLVYMRSDNNANPFTLHMVWQMRKNHVKVVMEIPTYPYDQEYIGFSRKATLLIDKCFRHTLAKRLSGVITFSDYQTIFGSRTIQISNGIDFKQIKLKKHINDTSHELHLIGVAEIHYWHGFDRLVKGLVNYYQANSGYNVYFHIVGNFAAKREENDILPLIKKYNLERYVILHGMRHGEELDELFEQADMGIGSLARHRSGITHIKTLKNREYAARGLPFIYSEMDSDFEGKPYILKAKADESPIGIPAILEFHRGQTLSPCQIRESVLSLSWESQMSKVLSEIDIENKK